MRIKSQSSNIKNKDLSHQSLCPSLSRIKKILYEFEFSQLEFGLFYSGFEVSAESYPIQRLVRRVRAESYPIRRLARRVWYPIRSNPSVSNDSGQNQSRLGQDPIRMGSTRSSWLWFWPKSTSACAPESGLRKERERRKRGEPNLYLASELPLFAWSSLFVVNLYLAGRRRS